MSSEGTDGAVEVVVSRPRCIAAKSCVNHAPGTFELDSSRVSTVKNPRGDPLESVIDAAENCPMGAISVFVDGERRAGR